MPAYASRAIEQINRTRVITPGADPGKIRVTDKHNFKLHDKRGSLDLLGKYKGLWDKLGKKGDNGQIAEMFAIIRAGAEALANKEQPALPPATHQNRPETSHTKT